MHEQPTGDAADELQLLTIDEAAQRLRIGRSLAYELAGPTSRRAAPTVCRS